MRRWFLRLCLCLLPLSATAQDSGDISAAATADDRTFLTAFLEDNLSGLGRKVTITGFQGALSSRATFTTLTIADGDGIWITINDGAISWNRKALLGGRVEIDELSAKAIDLPRAPHGEGEGLGLAGFSLPDLPVSVSIVTVQTDRLTLGADLLGEAAVVAISGSAQLAGGEGSTDFSIRRVDGREGQLALKGAFANATRMATIDLLVSEGANGIAATLLGLPGGPSTELALHGSGPVDNFSTNLALATDGAPRLTGNLLLTASKAVPGAEPDRQFAVHLAGDISPLLQPEYRDFFGTRVTLDAEGRHQPGKRTDLTRLVLDSDGVDLTGRLGLSPERIPLVAAMTLRFGLDGQRDLLLPIPGDPTFVRNGTLLLRYDAAKGNEWLLSGNLDGFRQSRLAIAALKLDGKGRVLQGASGPGKTGRIFGSVSFDANGLALADPALAEAVGERVRGQTIFTWQDGKPLVLRKLMAQAGDMQLSGDLALARQGLDLEVKGALEARAPDIGRFSALAGRPLGGAAEFRLSGTAFALSRDFDLVGTAQGQSLTVGQTILDRVLAKGSSIDFSARRDGQGITLRSLDLEVPSLTAHIAGNLGPDAQDLSAWLEAKDLSILGAGYGGRLAADARLSGPIGRRVFALDGTGEGLRLGAAITDRLLSGPSQVTVAAAEKDGAFALTRLSISNPQLSAEATGSDQPGSYALTARLANMAVLTPGFPGELVVSGHLDKTGADYDLVLDGNGPGQTSANVTGTVAADFRAVDLAISGTGQSAVLNGLIAPRSMDGPLRFDLRMTGAPALASLSGRVSGDGLRIASPNDRLSAENGQVMAELSDGIANVTANADLRGGGRFTLSGPVDLAPPHVAALSIKLDRAVLRTAKLFSSTVSGDISVDGALDGGAVIGGAVTLQDTEISVAAPSFGDAGPIGVSHVNEPGDVFSTRGRAGLTGASATAGRPRRDYGLDLVVSAPARLFVRGRGLDAEMGGTLHLRGTTLNVQPSGQFDLIRGRLNLLGKRFVLDEGVVQLLGSFVPYVNFSASADTFGSTATIVVEGPANAPAVHFTSSTGLPEEEVISQLLFGSGLNDISAFQLVQLANAVATLSGRGSESVIVRLRKSFGLDDLDITADESGNAALKAGKYLSDKIYSEASVGSDGKSRIQLNLDLNSDLSLRGTVGTDGTSGVGIFFDMDY